MLERIDIINNFNPLKGDSGTDTFVRYKKSKRQLIFNAVLVGFCFLFVFLAIINEYFASTYLPKWNKSSGILILLFSFFINFKTEIYKSILLRHLSSIENTNCTNFTNINANLEAILVKISDVKRGIPLILLAILIVVGGLLQSFMDGALPYWNYFILPLILLLLISIYRTFSNYKALKENITAFENQTIYA